MQVINFSNRDLKRGDLVIYDVDDNNITKDRRIGIVLNFHSSSNNPNMQLLFNPPVYEVYVCYPDGLYKVEEWYAGATRTYE
jgi:hypothetical protein